MLACHDLLCHRISLQVSEGGCWDVLRGPSSRLNVRRLRARAAVRARAQGTGAESKTPAGGFSPIFTGSSFFVFHRLRQVAGSHQLLCSSPDASPSFAKLLRSVREIRVSLDFRGSDSSRFPVFGGGIPMSTGILRDYRFAG